MEMVFYAPWLVADLANRGSEARGIPPQADFGVDPGATVAHTSGLSN